MLFIILVSMVTSWSREMILGYARLIRPGQDCHQHAMVTNTIL